MFKDIGYDIIFRKQAWKLFVKVQPLAIIFGIAWLFYIPNQPQSNHIEENALNPQLLSNSLSDLMSQRTEQIFRDLQQLQNEEDIQKYVLDAMRNYKMEVFNQDGNLIGKFHTKRSHNYECNLFTFDYGIQKLRNTAFILSLIQTLKDDDINYLSRDILFVATPSANQTYGKGIRAFLEEYTHPTEISYIPRCGVIRCAININLEDQFDSIALKLLGLNGRVPDRDFFLNINDLLQKSTAKYTYRDKGFSWLKEAERWLDKQIHQLWEILALNQYYVLPKKAVNFYDFFAMLIESIKGDLHEAHSYLFSYGIHAITIRGFQRDQTQGSTQTTQDLTRTISRVVEGANRAYMALDEHLHAGSTMYVPIDKSSSLTIQKYVWPTAIVAFFTAVQILYKFSMRFISNIKNEDRSIIRRDIAMAIVRSAVVLIMGLSLCFSPGLAEYLFRKLEQKEENFCETGNNEQLFNYFFAVVGGIVFIFYCIVNPAARYYLFGIVRMPRSYNALQHSLFNMIVSIALTMVYALILNLPIALIIAILIMPWILCIQPISPKPDFSRSDVLPYLINLGYLYVYSSLITSNYGLQDLVYHWKQLIVDYSCSGIHLFYYVHLMGIPSIINASDVLLF